MSAISQALKIAQNRGIFPTYLSATDTADVVKKLEHQVFWSARTTQAEYLMELKALVDRYVSGEGPDNDLAQLRVEARQLLATYGYTPERGFPGDAKLGIPPATAGSLRDLSSEKRLNLIFDTQAKLARGLGQKLRGIERVDMAPAWELVRVESRENIRDWVKRWNIAADNVDNSGVYAVLIAHKQSPIWPALGSKALFPDALDVDHAPFALHSGMGLREKFASELGDMLAPIKPGPGQANLDNPPSYVDEEDFMDGKAGMNRLLEKWRGRQR